MTRGLKKLTQEDIQRINQIVTGYPYDIWIHGQSGMADAKSILGLFLLSLNEDLMIVVEDDINCNALLKDLDAYLLPEEE